MDIRCSCYSYYRRRQVSMATKAASESLTQFGYF